MPRGVSRIDEAMIQRRLWTPAQIRTGLWYDCNDLAAIATGASGVQTLADKSGNGRNATQGTPANRPQISGTIYGTATGLAFNGSTQTMGLDGTFFVNSSYWVCMAHARSTSSAGFVFGAGGNNLNTNLHLGYSGPVNYKFGQWSNDIEVGAPAYAAPPRDRKSTRLNSSHRT